MEQIDSVVSSSIKEYHEQFRKNTATWDYLISQNHFSTETFRRCFDFKDKPIFEVGYPRNDILFRRNNERDIRRLKEKYNIPLDKKVILYAPTWRDNEFYVQGCYKFVSPLDFKKVQEELGDEYVFLVKYHYLVSDKIDWSEYKGFVYSFNEKVDISRLYLIADMMITDYSSVMFDYSILKRPMFFFAYDLENYENNLRGFYFDFLKEAPGPISKTTDQLIWDIKNYNAEQWNDKYKEFSDKYNSADDGMASKKIVEKIREFIDEKKVI